jgi:bacteriorhodopsin
VPPNMENYLEFTPLQYDLVTSIFTVGVAAHLAAFVYFLQTSSKMTERYKPASQLSAVIMVSAAFLLLRLEISWVQAMQFDPETGRYAVAGGSTFTHTYRYLNWLIDVPMLLIQMLFVFNLTRSAVYRLRIHLVVGGALMVVTGYVGQLYEFEAADGVPVAMLVWGAVSTVPYLWFSYLVFREIRASMSYLSPRVARTVKNIGWLFFFSWGLYPIAYLVPAFSFTAEAAVTRHYLFTVADVLSKVIFGVLLGKALLVRSAEDGHPAALAAPEMGVPLSDAPAPGRTEF